MSPSAESKKLKTIVFHGGEIGTVRERGKPRDEAKINRALVHDARIAHEQREVIRRLVIAIDALSDAGWDAERDWDAFVTDCTAARAAAAPFLED